MEFTDFVTAVGTLISDTLGQLGTNIIAQAVTSAFNDQWAATPVFNNSLTYVQTAFQYTLPSTITEVSAVYIQTDVSQNPKEISAELWEQIGSTLQFSNRAQYVLGNTYPLWLRGRYKVTVADTITNTVLQEYLLALSGYNCLRGLSYKRAISFLQNDTSMADILNLKNQMSGDVGTWRTQLSNEFVNA